jgi:hypothetical protein
VLYHQENRNIGNIYHTPNTIVFGILLIKAFYLSKNAKQILPLHFVEIIIRQSD